MPSGTLIPGLRLFGSPLKGSVTTNLEGDDNDLTFRSVSFPLGYREYSQASVEYVDPGAADQALEVSVSGTAITVSLATDGASAITSTAADVRDAVNADAEASALVTASDASGSDGTGVVTAMAETPLGAGRSRIIARA